MVNLYLTDIITWQHFLWLFTIFLNYSLHEYGNILLLSLEIQPIVTVTFPNTQALFFLLFWMSYNFQRKTFLLLFLSLFTFFQTHNNFGRIYACNNPLCYPLPSIFQTLRVIKWIINYVLTNRFQYFTWKYNKINHDISYIVTNR